MAARPDMTGHHVIAIRQHAKSNGCDLRYPARARLPPLLRNFGEPSITGIQGSSFCRAECPAFDAIHFLGKFGSFLISRICCMWRSACVEISSIHCQQSITCRSPKLWARMSSLVVLMYSIMVARSA